MPDKTIPKYRTFVPAELADDSDSESIHFIIIARRRNKEILDIGAFLVDRFCLGVKDAFFTQWTEEELQDHLESSLDGGYAVRDGAWGRKFVESAVAYAKSLGFAPHRDHKKAARVFGGVRAADCDEEFTFGCGGKPMYIRGPHDSDAMAQRILNTLRSRFGDDGFDYILPAEGASEEADGEDDDYWEAEVLCVAEQSGSSETMSPRLKKMLDDSAETGMDAEAVHFIPGGECAEGVKELVEALEFTSNQLSDEEHFLQGDEAHDMFVYLVTHLLVAHAMSFDRWEQLVRHEDEPMGESLINLVAQFLDDEKMVRLLDYLIHPNPETTRVVIGLQWEPDPAEDADPGEARILVMYAEMLSDEDEGLTG